MSKTEHSTLQFCTPLELHWCCLLCSPVAASLAETSQSTPAAMILRNEWRWMASLCADPQVAWRWCHKQNSQHLRVFLGMSAPKTSLMTTQLDTRRTASVMHRKTMWHALNMNIAVVHTEAVGALVHKGPFSTYCRSELCSGSCFWATGWVEVTSTAQRWHSLSLSMNRIGRIAAMCK